MITNVLCADKGRCGTYSHNFGNAHEARCKARAHRRASRKGEDDFPALSREQLKQLAASPLVAEAVSEGKSVLGPVEIRGSQASADNIYTHMSLKVIDGGFAAGCHAEGDLIVSGKDSTAIDCTADGVITVLGAARVKVTSPGQALVLIPRSEDRDENNLPVGASIRPDESTVHYPVETTFVYSTWDSKNLFRNQNLWAAYIDPWREFAALPKDNPLWVDARNEALRNWMHNTSGIDTETGAIDRDLLAIGLQLYNNPA